MTLDLSEGRYDRQQLLTWWDQDRLAASRVLVVGAGALGNELLKNLVLLGVGAITVIDFDRVSRSNLARCIFFRESDEAQPKAPVIARAVAGLNPAVEVIGLDADIRTQGLAWVSDFDVVVGGLDNREARLWINAACRKLGIPWIDGAIEGLRGVARTFLPEGPCYECTLGEADRAVIARRQSCSLLSTAEMLEGRVPTTATTSSVIAGIQVQEAIKLLTGRTDLLALRGEAIFFVGDTLETYRVAYSEDEFCLAHDRYGELREVAVTPGQSVSELLAILDVATEVGTVEAVDLEYDLVVSATCPDCTRTDPVERRVASLRPGDGECKACGAVTRLETRGSLSPVDDAALLAGPLSALDLRNRDVITARGASGRVHLALRMPA